MKFSTRTTYGLRAMTYLAWEYKNKAPVSLARIAKDEHLSLAYLERLFVLLKKEKLVKAERGAGGGYVLTEAPDKMNVFRIVKALEGDVVPFHCINAKGQVKCSSKEKCGASNVLMNVYVAISLTLKKMKLEDLVKSS
ncbi:MAG: Rrf2 family transcriptional regulator [Patescibacteria group bacterium]|nr:Rrf2 family transcriptional regulator [Patescibacteria group bacterium]